MLRELWEEFEREVPEPIGFEAETWEQEWADTLDDIRGGGVFLAEDDDGPVGVARIEAPRHGAAHVQLVYVRPRGRQQGVAKALLAECVADAKARGARLDQPRGPDRRTSRRSPPGGDSGSSTTRYAMASPLADARAAPRRERRGGRAGVDARADRRRGLGRARGRAVPAAARSTRTCRRTSSWIRVGDPVARSRPRGTRPLRARALRTARRGHRRARTRGRRRSLPALRAWPDGRRVPLGPDVLRRAAEGRRARARREPDARRAPHRRRPRRRQASRAQRAVPRELPPAAELYDADRRADGARGDEAHRRTALPVLRARAHRRSPRRASTYETVEVDLSNRPAVALSSSTRRAGACPSLDNGFTLPESEVIMAYLEERYPEPALLPGRPRGARPRAAARAPLRREPRRRLLRVPARRRRTTSPASSSRSRSARACSPTSRMCRG